MIPSNINNMYKKPSIIIIALLIITSTLANYSFATEKSPIQFIEYGPRPTPDDIPFFDKDGDKHYLEEYEGKTVLLVFWATWCSPCMQEMVDLDILQKDFRKLPFTILAISEDYQGVKAASDFYKAHNIRHLEVFHDYKNALFKDFKVVGMPTSFLITPDGRNVGMFKGVINWYDEEVRNILLSHIPGNPGEPKNSYKDDSLNQIINIREPKNDEAHEKKE